MTLRRLVRALNSIGLRNVQRIESSFYFLILEIHDCVTNYVIVYMILNIFFKQNCLCTCFH